MYRSIQNQIRRKLPVHMAFKQMDNNGQGYLSLRDFHISFARLFDLAIKNEDCRSLFNEIDSDENGIVTY